MELEVFKDNRCIDGRGGEQEMVLAQTCDRAVIQHDPIFAQHQAIPTPAHRERGHSVGIDEVEEGAGITARHFNFPEA